MYSEKFVSIDGTVLNKSDPAAKFTITNSTIETDNHESVRSNDGAIDGKTQLEISMGDTFHQEKDSEFSLVNSLDVSLLNKNESTKIVENNASINNVDEQLANTDSESGKIEKG